MNKYICKICGKDLRDEKFHITFDIESGETNMLCIPCLETLMRNSTLKRGVPDEKNDV